MNQKATKKNSYFVSSSVDYTGEKWNNVTCEIKSGSLMYLQCGADTMKPFMKISLSTSYLTFEKKE